MDGLCKEHANYKKKKKKKQWNKVMEYEAMNWEEGEFAETKQDRDKRVVMPYMIFFKQNLITTFDFNPLATICSSHPLI